MTEQRWVVVETVAGSLQAELVRGLLEAQGIPVYLSQEGAGRAIGLDVGPLGDVDVMVPTGKVEEARQVIQDYHNGVYEATTLVEGEEEPNLLDEEE